MYSGLVSEDSITIPNNQITKECEFCGRTIIVNNYPDRQPRTPRLFGMVICPWCDPRHPDDRWSKKPRIVNKVLWRTMASVRIAKKLTEYDCIRALNEGRNPTELGHCKCAGCMAKVYWSN